MKKLTASLLCIVTLVTTTYAKESTVTSTLKSPPLRSAATVEDLLDAIRVVETGHIADPNLAVGDHGKSRGPYQIMEAYYEDAKPFCRHLGVTLPSYDQTVVSFTWSRLCVRGYWERYARKHVLANNLEALARIHNGGPHGDTNSSTIAYWQKVRAQLVKRGFDV
jgi:hypothetical protein